VNGIRPVLASVTGTAIFCVVATIGLGARRRDHPCPIGQASGRCRARPCSIARACSRRPAVPASQVSASASVHRRMGSEIPQEHRARAAGEVP
jgi:hypothetical protein